MSKGTIIRRGKSSWRLKFDISPDPKTGERRTRYQTVKGTKREAQARLNAVLTAISGNTYVESSRMTFGEFSRQWIDTIAAAKVSPKTLERYDDLLRKQLLPAFEFARVQDITDQDIESLYTELGKTGRHDGKGGLSPRTIRHVHVLLGQIMKSAVRKRLIQTSPMSSVENTPKFEEKEIEVLDEQQLNTLLRSLKRTMLFMPSLLAASTGMRRGEILALRWRDVDLGQLTLTVAQSIEETRAGIRFKEPKTKSGRRQIALPESVVRALINHKREQAEQRLALGLGKDKNDLVFTTFDGRPRVPRNFTREFTKAVAASNLPAITFHGLRHTHITHLLRAGVPIKVVSERAGHASIAITLQTYAHVMPGMQEGAAALIEQSLKTAFED